MKVTRIVLMLFAVCSTAFAQIGTVPVIDGEIDSVWQNAATFSPKKLVRNMAGTEIESPQDFSGTFSVLWDATALYVLVDITDQTLHYIGESSSHNDNTEIYVDLNNSKLSEYDGIDDDQFRIEYSNTDSVSTKRATADLEFSQMESDSGWRVEIKLPWSDLTSESFTAAAGVMIGFDVMITDNDGDDDRKDHILAWHSPVNDAWKDASIFGVVELLASGTIDSIYYDPSPPEHDENPIDESKISKILYVDQSHVNADDENDGTDLEDPLMTIGAALEKASVFLGKAQATKIQIANGIYREGGLTVTPQGSPNSFLNTELVLEGEQAGEVVISGSDVWDDGWTSIGANTWQHEWPFVMEPKQAWNRTTELGSRREMLFVDGQWMRQVLSEDDLAENTFYVVDNDKIVVQVSAGIDFENVVKEVSMRGDGLDAPWPPQGLFRVPAEKDKVVFRNLIFQHANNRLHNTGAVVLDGWKIKLENCQVNWNNGFGLQIRGVQQIELLNSNFDHNGGCGIMTWGTEYAKLQDCTTSWNNWRGDQGGLNSYAVAGIKFHHSHAFDLINHISSHNLAPGLWTDLDVTDFTYQNCTVQHNWGAGFLVEISDDISIDDCTVAYNATGMRIHSSHNCRVLDSRFEGNAIHISLYDDHRDFSDANWQDQLGMVWDKTPHTWTLENNEFIATDNPAWQDSLETRVPHWINYTNPGYQPFFHFSKKNGYLQFFETATIQFNTWTHPATDTPFMDADGNPLTLAQWRWYIKTLGTTDVDSNVPLKFELGNYPNPFNPGTHIQFTLPEPQHVKIVIYNALGKEIRTLVDEKIESGTTTRYWNGCNQQGLPVASGPYFYKLKSKNYEKNVPCLLLK